MQQTSRIDMKSLQGRRRFVRQGLALGAASVWPGLARAQTAAGHQPLIANGWPAHASLLLMLGAGPRIAATVNSPKARPWMYVVQPSLHKALLAPRSGFVAEALLAHGVSLAFLTPDDTSGNALQAAGIQVVRTVFQDFAGLRECVELTARTLGGDAVARARAYLHHLDTELAEVARWSQSLTEQQRPRVLHVAQWAPQLLVDGTHTMIDEWIRAAGGRNAVTDIQGSLRPVEAERLLAWEPDIIIQSASSASQRRPPGYDALKAVREKRVLTNPEGVFPWDRYGCEISLQLRWAASQLHPGRVPVQDMPARVQAFYKDFFSFDALTRAQAERMLQGLPPA